MRKLKQKLGTLLSGVKKLNTLILLLILLLSGSFWGCNEDRASLFKQQIFKGQASEGVSADLKPEDIARIHNEIVAAYEELEKGNQNILAIEKDVVKLMKDKHPDIMKNFKVNNLGENLLKTAYKNDHFDLDLFMKNAIPLMKSKTNVSQDVLDTILYIVKNEKEWSSGVNRIENYYLNHKLSEEDSYVLNTFRSVLLASYNYWHSKPNYSSYLSNKNFISSRNIFKNAPKDPPSEEKKTPDVVSADAVGAALGLLGGPLWSIIQGAIVSIAVSDAPEPEN